jgi:hypothetical protein
MILSPGLDLPNIYGKSLQKWTTTMLVCACHHCRWARALLWGGPRHDVRHSGPFHRWRRRCRRHTAGGHFRHQLQRLELRRRWLCGRAAVQVSVLGSADDTKVTSNWPFLFLLPGTSGAFPGHVQHVHVARGRLETACAAVRVRRRARLLKIMRTRPASCSHSFAPAGRLRTLCFTIGYDPVQRWAQDFESVYSKFQWGKFFFCCLTPSFWDVYYGRIII